MEGAALVHKEEMRLQMDVAIGKAPPLNDAQTQEKLREEAHVSVPLPSSHDIGTGCGDGKTSAAARRAYCWQACHLCKLGMLRYRTFCIRALGLGQESFGALGKFFPLNVTRMTGMSAGMLTQAPLPLAAPAGRGSGAQLCTEPIPGNAHPI